MLAKTGLHEEPQDSYSLFPILVHVGLIDAKIPFPEEQSLLPLPGRKPPNHIL
jgi:hypothetical protein